MAWYDFFKKRPQQLVTDEKSSAVVKLMIPHTKEPQGDRRSYQNYAKDGYMSNVIAYSCIRLIAQSASFIDLKVYKRKKDARKGEPYKDHPLQALLYQPNPIMGGSRFIEYALSYYLISGNIFVERVVLSGKKYELWLQRPDLMRILPGSGGVPAGYVFSWNGQSMRWDYDPVNPNKTPILHVKTFNPMDLWWGQSYLEAAGMAVDSHNDATKFNKAILSNGGRPSGVVEYTPPTGAPSSLSDDAFYRLKAELDENYSGPVNAGRMMLLEGGLKWVQNQLSSTDISWKEGKEVSATEIALAFRVPDQLVGIKGAQTFNNVREAKLSLYEDAILPVLSIFLEELTNWFRPIYGDDFYIGYDEDTIPALAIRRELVWDRVTKADHISINEKRAATGYQEDPSPAANKILVPSTQTFLEDAGLNTRQEGGTTFGEDKNKDVLQITPSQMQTILAIINEGLDEDATQTLIRLAVPEIPDAMLNKITASLDEKAEPIDHETAKNNASAAYGADN